MGSFKGPRHEKEISTEALIFLRAFSFFSSPAHTRRVVTKFLLLLSFLFLSSSCSLYKSAVRKDFESNSSGKVRVSFLGECEKINSLKAWITRELASDRRELLISEPNLEVWLLESPTGEVEIRADFRQQDGHQICSRHFESQLHWEQDESAYLAALEARLQD